MPLSDDEFDTMIQAVIAGPPTPAAGPAPPHRVLRFAAGTALWLTAANLGYLFVWLLAHG